ncbi:Blue copper protein 1a [Linum perenne]
MSDPILVALCILISSAVASGTDHIVGDNKGRNPGINYTLWANNQTFYVGDFIYKSSFLPPLFSSSMPINHHLHFASYFQV